MKDRLRLPLTFDAATLQADLRRLEDGAWVRHFVTQNYDGEWTVLPLRAPANATHPVQMIYSDPSCDEYVDTPLLATCPGIADALKTFECPLESVRLMRLGAGSVIKTHRDHDLDVEHGRARLHVPIATNPDVDFRLNGERVTLGEGECWYLRLSDPHSVANHGDRDRIHLVIDAIVSPWLHELLERADAEAQVRRPGAEDPGPSTDGRQPGAVSGDPAPSFPAWVPARVEQARVEWCSLDGVAVTDPFFSDTIRRAKRTRRPLESSLDVLMEEAAARPGLTPAGFIFHCSRCGSTLVSQLARALAGTVVISEAPAIDDVLRSGWPDETRRSVLRAVLSAFGQPRAAGDRHLIVKFDAWHVLDVPLIQEAFPGVPCVFVYRRPADVIASQMRIPAEYLVPGALDPSIAGLASVEDAIAIGRVEYCARVIGRLLQAAAELSRAGRIDVMRYADFPDAAIARVLAWTGREASAEDRARLRERAAFDAKTPGLPFVVAAAGAAGPSDPLQEAAAAFAGDAYSALEHLTR